jgi:hypothetical protein
MAKSVEVKLNEALEKLKKASATKYDQVWESIHPGGFIPIQTQLTMVEAGLSELKESSPRIAKKNGRSENIIEGNPFNEGRSNNGGTTITETDPIVTRKEAMVESTMAQCGLTEAGARAALGLKQKAPEGLTDQQAAEYSFARRCGISEADAMTLAKMPLRAIR